MKLYFDTIQLPVLLFFEVLLLSGSTKLARTLKWQMNDKQVTISIKKIATHNFYSENSLKLRDL